MFFLLRRCLETTHRNQPGGCSFDGLGSWIGAPGFGDRQRVASWIAELGGRSGRWPCFNNNFLLIHDSKEGLTWSNTLNQTHPKDSGCQWQAGLREESCRVCVRVLVQMGRCADNPMRTRGH